MTSIFTAKSLRDVLAATYAHRHQKNPSYSYRAFARDLALTPSHLNDILHRKTGLSVSKAKAVGKALGLNARENDFFCSLVESQHSASLTKRKQAETRLQTFRLSSLSLDQFKVISEWHYLAVMEMLNLNTELATPKGMADYLGLPVAKIRETLATLIRLNLVSDRESHYVLTNELLEIGEDVPATAIRNLHKDVLKKALVAIDSQPVETRDYSTSFVAIDAANYVQAKKRLEDFQRAFVSEFGSGTGKDSLYCLGTQFFSLQAADEKKS